MSISHSGIVGSGEDSAGKPAQVVWTDEAQTEAFAQQLARSPALHNCFIALHGELGAGKTTFVRALLRALGVSGRIKSPTYAVVEPHVAGDLSIWHFDFYRFNDPHELEEAGLRELFAGPGLKIAEWPEQAAGALPLPDLDMHINTLDDASRHVKLMAHTPTGRDLLREVQP